MIQGKSILITGGAGFIGSHLASRLVASNRVTLLDTLPRGNCLDYLPLASDDRIRVIEGDVRNAGLVEELTTQADMVVHSASLLGVRHVVENARETIDVILTGTRNVLDAAAKHKNLTRMVNLSTSEVYGEGTVLTEGGPASIGTANDPRLSYASAKLAAEHMAWAYYREFAVPVVNVRPFNLYGPWRKTSNAVGCFAVQALHNLPVTLHGDGSHMRSWCHIDEFTDALLTILEIPTAIGEEFNLGHDQTKITNLELAKQIIELTASQSSIKMVDYPFSDIAARAPNLDKAKALLSWTPKVNLATGLPGTIDWYREHLEDFEHWRS